MNRPSGLAVVFVTHGPGLAGRIGTPEKALAAQRTAARRQLTAVIPGLYGFALAVQAAFTVLLMTGTLLAVGGTLDAPQLLALLVLGVRMVEPMTLAAEHGGALRLSGTPWTGSTRSSPPVHSPNPLSQFDLPGTKSSWTASPSATPMSPCCTTSP